MWLDHPFSQRIKTSKIEVEVKAEGEEVKVGGNGEEGLDKILKRWSRQYRGAFIQKGELGAIESLRELFSKKGVLIVWGKSLKRLAKEFSFSKVAG